MVWGWGQLSGWAVGRGGGQAAACVNCLWFSSWQSQSLGPCCHGAQPTFHPDSFLSACPHIQFSLCSLVVGFAVGPEAKSLALYSEYVEVCGEEPFCEKGTSHTRSQKNTNVSIPLRVLYVKQTFQIICPTAMKCIFQVERWPPNACFHSFHPFFPAFLMTDEKKTWEFRQQFTIVSDHTVDANSERLAVIIQNLYIPGLL